MISAGAPTDRAPARNLDPATVHGFGDEWTRFDQSGLSPRDREEVFASYFGIFPWAALPPNAVGFDLGSGSGRWASVTAGRVGTLHLIDASREALEVARSNLHDRSNCIFHHASVDAIPLADESMDFGYSLGVLHHVPDTAAGIRACVKKLKPGAPLLLYLYYAFDNRPGWFPYLWKGVDRARKVISRLPPQLRYATSQAVAAGVYFPLARAAWALEQLGMDVQAFPLSIYRRRSFYVMRNDALDRFGTRLEQRFTAAQIRSMMEAAGLERITFSEAMPHWCSVGYKRSATGLF